MREREREIGRYKFECGNQESCLIVYYANFKNSYLDCRMWRHVCNVVPVT